MRGAKVVVDVLKEQQVDVVFGIPGGVTLPLYDEFYNAKLHHILARHEQCAGHMADGYARVSKRPGVACVTSGPGVTNLITGIATAYMDSSPVIALTGQVATAVMGNDAFQEADAFGLMMPVTKHNFRVLDAKELVSTIRKAFMIATTGRYGPVHIDLPVDVLQAEVDGKALDAPPEPKKPQKRDLSGLLDAIKLLEEAENPVILVGGGASWSQAGTQIVEFAEILGAPVVTTLMGKGAVPEDHPLVLGPVGMHGKQVASYVLNNCDVLLALGTRFSDRSTGKLSEFGKSTKTVHVDIDASEMGKNVKGVVSLIGDAWTVITALTAGMRQRARKDRSTWLRRVEALKRECACSIDIPASPIVPQKIIHELNRLLPDDGIVTTEVGRNQMWAEHFFEVRGKRMFITSGGLGTMGFGFPAAIGAKVARPSSAVVDIAGDGSIQMVFQEFATAMENQLPVIVAVINDGYLGMVKQWQKMFYGNRLSAVDLHGRIPDFVKLAGAFGAGALRVERPSELPEAITTALKSEVPYLLDITVDPEEDMLPMMPPGKKASEVILGPRCNWKGGTTVGSDLAPRA